MSNEYVLPSSRLTNETLGSVMMDWPLPDGRTVRVECVRVYCANCGVLHGLVPREGNTWDFWLCQQCYESHGAIANTYAMPDQEFWDKVSAEMQARFGRDLSAVETAWYEQQGQLGAALESLARESPYKVCNP